MAYKDNGSHTKAAALGKVHKRHHSTANNLNLQYQVVEQQPVIINANCCLQLARMPDRVGQCQQVGYMFGPSRRRTGKR